MKQLLFLLGLTLASSAAFAQASCPKCPDMARMQQEMVKTPAEPLNEDTIAAQDRLLDRGVTLVRLVLREPQLSSETAESVLLLLAKLIAYDNGENSALYAPGTSALFHKHYDRRTNNVLKPALAKLIAERRLTGEEKSDLCEAFYIQAP